MNNKSLAMMLTLNALSALKEADPHEHFTQDRKAQFLRDRQSQMKKAWEERQAEQKEKYDANAASIRADRTKRKAENFAKRNQPPKEKAHATDI